MESKKTMENVHVRTITKEDYSKVNAFLTQTEWALELSFPHNLYEVDPVGWIIAFNDAGEILGLICGVQLTDKFHYVGYCMVKEEFREMGIARKIWNALTGYIGQRNACFACASDMLHFLTTRTQFTNVDDDILSTFTSGDEIKTENLSSEVPEGVSIVPFDHSHIQAILDYDNALGEEVSHTRQRIIELNCKDEHFKTLVAFQNGTCIGYGTMKITFTGIRCVAPLYADDAKVAEAMLKKLIQCYPKDKGLIMSTFSRNKVANDLMEKLKCPEAYKSYHVYIKKDPRSKLKSSMHKLIGMFDIGFLEH